MHYYKNAWSNNDIGFIPFLNIVEVIHSICELKLSLLKPLWKVQKLWVILPKRNTCMHNTWGYTLQKLQMNEAIECISDSKYYMNRDNVWNAWK